MLKKQWRRILVAGALLAAWHSGQAQPVYKWVDASGKTHYGSQPPPSDKDVEPLKLQGNGSTAKNHLGGTKPIPKDTQEMMQGMETALKKVDPKSVPLSCSAAVNNVRSQVTTMLETGQRNVQQGYTKAADFEGVAAKLRHGLSNTTTADCQSASGNKKLFYQCMSSDRNHVAGCGSKYKF
ncbi:DUF4124 domain-containing protein [Polaromonas aquatica]|uniref:DUF4124 domain-containing protein n=1 Tax=Polaromonas aquatica TaxID=332657 RepID=UPI003D64980D